MNQPAYLTRLEQVSALSPEKRKRLEEVTDSFAFRANEYYLSLIDWNDPEDPIRKLIVPDIGELEVGGQLDPSSERSYTVGKGLQHKYRQTALLLVSDLCGGFCRFCFRKRLFMDGGRELSRDVSEDLSYIRDHPEITNVLLSGGDPLILPTERLEEIIRRIRQIDHVRIIRIGSKMPAYNPYRIINDPSLLEMVRRYSEPTRRIYFMTQFNHPRELTEPALHGIELLQEAGAMIANQTPLIRGVNDEEDVLARLLQKLSFIGVPPYYVFQCRPTIGNAPFRVPIEESYLIFERAKAKVSGLAKRARFVMSHATGKIEIVGMSGDYTYFKYAQAAEPENIGKFMVFRSNPDAYWFDDYDELVDETTITAKSPTVNSYLGEIATECE